MWGPKLTGCFLRYPRTQETQRRAWLLPPKDADQVAKIMSTLIKPQARLRWGHARRLAAWLCRLALHCLALLVAIRCCRTGIWELSPSVTIRISSRRALLLTIPCKSATSTRLDVCRP